jgi:GH18 family chitinase
MFTIDGTIVGEDAVSPYQMYWPAQPTGDRLAAAIAVDDDGLESQPQQVPFLVADSGVQPLDAPRIVGYFPSYRSGEQQIQFDKLTEVIYAFVLPNPDGTLQGVPNPSKLSRLQAAAANWGVKVGIAIGGWNNGDDSAFEALAASPSRRAVFVKAVLSLTETYNLDLVDLDWEYPDLGTSAANFKTLVSELSSALHARGKLFSIAVAAHGAHGDAVSSEVFANVDFVNIMAYDSGETNHSTYAYAQNALNYWLGRGLSAHKAILGVPFYSRPNPRIYADLVHQDQANACRDNDGTTYWNGIPTIRKKAELALAEAGGIMNWELGQDSSGPESLLTAKWEIMSGLTPSYSCADAPDVPDLPTNDCTNYPPSIPSYPNWPRVDWQGLPSHAIGGDLMSYKGAIYKALWWTTSLPGSDASWQQLCP